MRIIGEVTRERLDILRAADAIILEEIRRAGLYREIWQAFGVLPAIRSVGVQGDERTYAYPLIVRAVTSEDAMTADWARLPYEVLERISTRVINEVRRHQPGRLRHLLEAAGHHRVGVAAHRERPRSSSTPAGRSIHASGYRRAEEPALSVMDDPEMRALFSAELAERSARLVEAAQLARSGTATDRPIWTCSAARPTPSRAPAG